MGWRRRGLGRQGRRPRARACSEHDGCDRGVRRQARRGREAAWVPPRASLPARAGERVLSDQGRTPVRAHGQQMQTRPAGESLADILERVLDKGIVIAGDIQINLLDIELLTIKLRLLVASVDKAREMGINWWEGDPSLQSLDSGDSDGN